MAFLLCYSLDINISHVHINYKHAKVSQSKIFVTSSGAASQLLGKEFFCLSLQGKRDTGRGMRDLNDDPHQTK
jgi:hypothetical protein